jgi:hypothetical protein
MSALQANSLSLLAGYDDSDSDSDSSCNDTTEKQTHVIETQEASAQATSESAGPQPSSVSAQAVHVSVDVVVENGDHANLQQPAQHAHVTSVHSRDNNDTQSAVSIVSVASSTTTPAECTTNSAASHNASASRGDTQEDIGRDLPSELVCLCLLPPMPTEPVDPSLQVWSSSCTRLVCLSVLFSSFVTDD